MQHLPWASMLGNISLTVYSRHVSLYITFRLAHEYKFFSKGDNIESICLYNARVALESNLKSIAKTWVTLSKIPSFRSVQDVKILKDFYATVDRSRECKLKYSPHLCSCPTPTKAIKPLRNLDGQTANSSNFRDHPFGFRMLKNIIAHYMQMKDIQMVRSEDNVQCQILRSLF